MTLFDRLENQVPFGHIGSSVFERRSESPSHIEFILGLNNFLKKVPEKISKFAVKYRSSGKTSFRKIRRINKVHAFSQLSLIPRFQWLQVMRNQNLPKKIYTKDEVNDTLRSICDSIYSPHALDLAPQQLFILRREYWNDENLQDVICQAVTIVDSEFSDEDKKKFFAEFCAGVHGVDGQCGRQSHRQIFLTVDKVVKGLFSRKEDADFSCLIVQHVNDYAYKVAQERFSQSSSGTENRASFERILTSVKRGEWLDPPEVVAKRILCEIQTQSLIDPQRWRANLESAYSEKAFITSSKCKLGETFSLQLENPFYLTITAILQKMEELGIVAINSSQPATHNDFDCLELLALAKKLPVESTDEYPIIDQVSMKRAIYHYFHPATALVNGLHQVALYGRQEQIDLMRQIFEGSKQMELLDEAVSLNFVRQLPTPPHTPISFPSEDPSVRAIDIRYQNDEL